MLQWWRTQFSQANASTNRKQVQWHSGPRDRMPKLTATNAWALTAVAITVTTLLTTHQTQINAYVPWAIATGLVASIALAIAIRSARNETRNEKADQTQKDTMAETWPTEWYVANITAQTTAMAILGVAYGVGKWPEGTWLAQWTGIATPAAAIGGAVLLMAINLAYRQRTITLTGIIAWVNYAYWSTATGSLQQSARINELIQQWLPQVNG